MEEGISEGMIIMMMRWKSKVRVYSSLGGRWGEIGGNLTRHQILISLPAGGDGDLLYTYVFHMDTFLKSRRSTNDDDNKSQNC